MCSGALEPVAGGNLYLFNGDGSSQSPMEEMKLNEGLLIKYWHYNLHSVAFNVFFFFLLSSHLHLSLTHTHTMAQCCVCSRAGGLRGLISELARYSHKTDRPTNYPKNYNILMFALTAMFSRAEARSLNTQALHICLFSVCVQYVYECVCVRGRGRVYYADSWRWPPACRAERTDVCCGSLFYFCSAYFTPKYIKDT